MQRRTVKDVKPAWTPNWQFDVFCLEQALADKVSASFSVNLIPVEWHTQPLAKASQVFIPSWGEHWFERRTLKRTCKARHGSKGSKCSKCGIFRWMPVLIGPDSLTAPDVVPPPPDDCHVMASPEWFGDGWKSFRQILWRRELGELIADASPRDYSADSLPN